MSTSLDGENPGDWISASEAARLRGVSRQAIGSLVRRGRLRTLDFGGKRFVSRRDVEAYVPDAGGRPRKKAAPKKASQKKKAKPKIKTD
jgi:excisionase family DNA binding protein